MKKFLVLVSMFLISCGSSSNSKEVVPQNLNLKGTNWFMQIDDTGDCGIGVSFLEKTYTQLYGCVKDNTLYTEIETGDYTTTTTAISFKPIKSSCKDVSGGEFDTKELTVNTTLKEKDSLILAFPYGQYHLKFNTETATNFSVLYGCFVDDDFVFSDLK